MSLVLSDSESSESHGKSIVKEAVPDCDDSDSSVHLDGNAKATVEVSDSDSHSANVEVSVSVSKSDQSGDNNNDVDEQTAAKPDSNGPALKEAPSSDLGTLPDTPAGEDSESNVQISESGDAPANATPLPVLEDSGSDDGSEMGDDEAGTETKPDDVDANQLQESDSSSDISNLNESSDETSSDDSSMAGVDTDDPMELKVRLLQSKKKWLQATVTIQSLIEQFTEYKETVEEEKSKLLEAVAQRDLRLRAEKERYNEQSQETITNLRTLMMELEMIENRNNELAEELDVERNEHEQTLSALQEAEQQVSDLQAELEALRESKPTEKSDALLSPTSLSASTVLRAGGVSPRGGTKSTPHDSLLSLRKRASEAQAKLDKERRVLLEVTTLVNQLNVALGSSAALEEALKSSNAVAGLDALQGIKSAAAKAPQSGGNGSAPLNKAFFDLPALPSSDTTKRVQDTILKITKAQKNDSDMIGDHAESFRCSDEHLVSVLSEKSAGAVSAMLTVGNYVWVGCQNAYLDVYELSTNSRISSHRPEGRRALTRLTLVADTVWATGADGKILIYYASSGEVKSELSAHQAKVTGVCCVRAKQEVWTIGADMHLRVWRYSANHGATEKINMVKDVSVQSYMISIVYHVGMVWIGTESCIIRFSAQSHRQIDQLDRNGQTIPCVNQMCSDGTNVWTLSGDNLVTVWSADGEQMDDIQRSERLLGLYAVRNNVVLSSTASLLFYDDTLTLVYTIEKPHAESVKALCAVGTPSSASKSNGNEKKNKVEPADLWTGAADRTLCTWRLPASKASKPEAKRKRGGSVDDSAIASPSAVAALKSLDGGLQRASSSAGVRRGNNGGGSMLKKRDKRVARSGTNPIAVSTGTVDDNVDVVRVLLMMKAPKTGIQLKDKKHGFGGFGKKYRQCFSARELVDWCRKNVAELQSRFEAVRLCQELISEHLIECVSESDKTIFKEDNSLWHFAPPRSTARASGSSASPLTRTSDSNSALVMRSPAARTRVRGMDSAQTFNAGDMSTMLSVDSDEAASRLAKSGSGGASPLNRAGSGGSVTSLNSSGKSNKRHSVSEISLRKSVEERNSRKDDESENAHSRPGSARERPLSNRDHVEDTSSSDRKAPVRRSASYRKVSNMPSLKARASADLAVIGEAREDGRSAAPPSIFVDEDESSQRQKSPNGGVSLTELIELHRGKQREQVQQSLKLATREVRHRFKDFVRREAEEKKAKKAKSGKDKSVLLSVCFGDRRKDFLVSTNTSSAQLCDHVVKRFIKSGNSDHYAIFVISVGGQVIGQLDSEHAPFATDVQLRSEKVRWHYELRRI